MATAKKLTTSVTPKRRYSNDLEVDTDTFKLELSYFIKNIGFDDQAPLPTSVEHCHFFHTYDSSGKPQDKCNSVGGHWHDIKVTLDEEGNLTAECSTPRSNRPLIDNDSHVHKVTYIKSDRIQVRKLNPDAQKEIARMGSY